MVELSAKSPCADILPRRVGKLEAVEVDLGVLTSVMAYDGQDDELSSAVQAAHGMAFPAVNRATGKEGARAIWFGRGQVLLAGPAPDARLAKFAAVVDQSDAWACVELSGPGAEDVLARLVPIDLRKDIFKTGYSARTMIQHMNGSVTCLGADRYLLMVFRSMAGTLVHDLFVAMESVVSRS